MRVVNDHHVGLVYHPLDLMNRFKVGEQLLNPHPLQTKICIHIGDVGICQHHGIQTVERTIGVVLTPPVTITVSENCSIHSGISPVITYDGRFSKEPPKLEYRLEMSLKSWLNGTG